MRHGNHKDKMHSEWWHQDRVNAPTQQEPPMYLNTTKSYVLCYVRNSVLDVVHIGNNVMTCIDR